MDCPKGGECLDPEACLQGAPCEVVIYWTDVMNERKRSERDAG